MIVFARIFM